MFLALFTSVKKKVWKQMAAQLNVDFKKGNWLECDKVFARHKEWTITLDTVDDGNATTITRFRAPFINKYGFRFTLYRENFFTKLGKKMGIQDVEIGDTDFDNAFVIQGTDEYKLWKFFKNDRIRELIHFQPKIHFSITSPADNNWFQKKFESNVDELQFRGCLGFVFGVENESFFA